MKPFNLERALAGDKVVTRDGREVTFVGHFPKLTPGYRVAAIIAGDQIIRQFGESGKYNMDGQEAITDLFMAPKTVKRWVNFYAEGGVVDFGTELLAKTNGKYCAGLIAIAVPVEFEEGYGCEAQP